MKNSLLIAAFFSSMFLLSACTQATLPKQNDQSGSGHAQNQDQQNELSQADQRRLVRQYLSENINDISPKEPVLGGTFMVTSIVWKQDGTALVQYEDGHIAVSAVMDYEVNPEGDVVINSFTVQEDPAE